MAAHTTVINAIVPDELPDKVNSIPAFSATSKMPAAIAPFAINIPVLLFFI